MANNETDWKTVLGVLTHEFGEDRAQAAALRMLEDIEKGVEIYNPIEYGRTYCMWLIMDDRKKHKDVQFVCFEKLRQREADGLSVPRALTTTLDPFNQVAAREILESLPQTLVDQILYYDEYGDGYDNRLAAAISTKRKKLRAYAD